MRIFTSRGLPSQLALFFSGSAAPRLFLLERSRRGRRKQQVPKTQVAFFSAHLHFCIFCTPFFSPPHPQQMPHTQTTSLYDDHQREISSSLHHHPSTRPRRAARGRRISLPPSPLTPPPFCRSNHLICLFAPRRAEEAFGCARLMRARLGASSPPRPPVHIHKKNQKSRSSGPSPGPECGTKKNHKSQKKPKK